MLGAWARPRRSTPPESATCCHALATSGSRACNCLAQGAPNVSAPFPNERGSSWHFPAPMVLGSRPHECTRGPSRVALRLWGGGGHPAGAVEPALSRVGRRAAESDAQHPTRLQRRRERGLSGRSRRRARLRTQGPGRRSPPPPARLPRSPDRKALPLQRDLREVQDAGPRPFEPPPTSCRAPHVAVSLCSPRLRHPLHAGAFEGSAPRTSSLCTLPVPPMIKL